MTGIMLAAVLLVASPPVPPERPAEPPPALVEPALPPYQVKLERLAELMGVLDFMRSLCEVGDGTLWRDKMTDLLAAEGTTDLRRDRLAGAFNRGLAEYQSTYRRCTPSASLVIDRALREGGRLAQDLSTRFGS